MDHVVSSLQRWADIFKESTPDDERAQQCIENAIAELQKYYSSDE